MIVKMKCTLSALGLVLAFAPGPSSAAPAKGESELLFVQLPRLPRPGEPALVVEFRVHVDQRLFVDERIAVDGGAAAAGLRALAGPEGKTHDSVAPSLQILSRDPARVRELRRLAAEGGHQIEIEATADGEPLLSLTFEELLEHSRGLIQQPGFRPLALPSRVQRSEAASGTPPEFGALRSTGATTATVCGGCEATFPGCARTECPWWNAATMSPTWCVSCWQVVQQCFTTCTPDPCQPSNTPTNCVCTPNPAQTCAPGTPKCEPGNYVLQPTKLICHIDPDLHISGIDVEIYAVDLFSDASCHRYGDRYMKRLVTSVHCGFHSESTCASRVQNRILELVIQEGYLPPTFQDDSDHCPGPSL